MFLVITWISSQSIEPAGFMYLHLNVLLSLEVRQVCQSSLVTGPMHSAEKLVRSGKFELKPSCLQLFKLCQLGKACEARDGEFCEFREQRCQHQKHPVHPGCECGGPVRPVRAGQDGQDGQEQEWDRRQRKGAGWGVASDSWCIMMHHIGISYVMSMSSKVSHYNPLYTFSKFSNDSSDLSDDSSARHATWTAIQPLNGLRRVQFHDVKHVCQVSLLNGFGIVDPHTHRVASFRAQVLVITTRTQRIR